MKRWIEIMDEIEVLYADSDLIAIHKNPGIPCQSKSQEQDIPSLDRYFPGLINEEIIMWNRIDQPVGGIVLWRRPRQDSYLDQVSIVQKKYIAIVQGQPNPEKGTLQTQLRRDGRTHKAIEDLRNGKPARLDYQTIAHLDHYSILEIHLHTGRFHQIRKQLAGIGHPVKGDVKYGARRKNPDRSIDLHAVEYIIQKEGSSITISDRSFPRNNLWSHVEEYYLSGTSKKI